ncbi:LolA-like protein [Alkaliflexus imshenetskii]|uniref:hypothetical protein n=1 Tax=Alkaliflexus imshenetskii TaxID=286730 RepID=UPI0004B4268A|nr:hypothetical protein [Alkaliflexus imshenetskii]
MKLKSLTILLLAITMIPSIAVSQAYKGKVSVKARHQVYQKGQLFTVESTSLYDGSTGNITCHYIAPVEFYKTINTKGETMIYMPRENQVSFTQNSQYGSDSELLYYFVNNFTQDLGLEKEGFIRSGSRRDNKYHVTVWQAPPGLKPVHTVELVFENFLPVYAAYLGMNGRPLKKIYYYEYHHDNNFSLPKKITEVSYSAPNDSVVRRTTFSDIRTGFNIEDSRFNFEIPQNAVKVNF